MHKWFEAVIKYEKTVEEGKIVKATEKYLVDALSFTEAEARMTEEMKPFISGEFLVYNLSPKSINEIFWNDEGDKWFRAKVNFITLDKDKGVEKKTANYMMVQATEIKDARENLVQGIQGSMDDYEIESISETKILDVYEYEEKTA